MTNAPNRLERALDLFVRFELGGGDWSQLLRDHGDLADLLEAFRDDRADAGDMAAVGPAAVVLGDFALGRELGRGGSGTVYEALDRRLGRRVAVKVLQPELAENPTALARMRREAQTLARLDHRGIVRVLGVGADAGRHWLAMEFVDGESLAARLAGLREHGGHRGDSLRRLVEAIADVADALQHAHEAEVVHRDVKPSNILLRADGHAVLTDFGIARDDTDLGLTRTGAVVGSPHYMAPEQLRGGGSACGPRSDVFALGATLYECVTLQRAFDGGTLETVLQAVLSADPEDPRRRNRALPPDLVAILWRALEKQPLLRYPTARAFADDLRAFLELREVSVRAPSLALRWWRRLRRQPLVGALAAVFVVALALAGWIVWQLPRLDAAAASERERAYQEAVVAGFLDRGPDRGRAELETAFALDPTRCEAVLGLAFAASRREGPAAGLAELERRATACRDESIDRCRVWLWQRTGRHEEAVALQGRLGPPRDAMALWLEAMICIASLTNEPDRGPEALALLSQAVRVARQPNLLLDMQWTVVAVQFGDVATRREAAETLLTLWPDHPLALQQAAVALLKVDPVRAREIMQRAVERGGSDPLLRPNMGIAMALAGDTERAIPALVDAFDTPGLGSSHRSVVLSVLRQLGADDVADRLARQWLEQEPDDLAARLAAVRAALRVGDHARGLELLCAAPSDGEFDLERANALVAAGQADEARTIAERLVQSRPSDVRYHAVLMRALDTVGDHAAAIAELGRWTAVKPDEADGWRALAMALVAAGDLARAADAAERAERFGHGDDRELLLLRADVHDRLGEPASATRLRARAAALEAR